MKISEFQKQIEDIYFKKDSQRGIEGTFMWFAEEIGELTRAIRRDDDRENLEEEFADVLAWLVTLASMKGISLEDVAKKKYAQGCPYCNAEPCTCS
jgi:NTP pyrophosphatase (non-canonical NTP hydrolase)